MSGVGGDVDSDALARMLSFCQTMLTEESAGLGLPDFPIENLYKGVAVMNAVPELLPYDVLSSLYPYKLFLSSDGRSSVEGTMETFQLLKSGKSPR